eukprot:scaffold1444_cov134-Isochrysis_galbana.AAC.5
MPCRQELQLPRLPGTQTCVCGQTTGRAAQRCSPGPGVLSLVAGPQHEPREQETPCRLLPGQRLARGPSLWADGPSSRIQRSGLNSQWRPDPEPVRAFVRRTWPAGARCNPRWAAGRTASS